MPWVFMPMKDVLSCVKLRGAAEKRYYPEMSEWGNPARSNPRSLIVESRRKAVIDNLEGTQRTETT